MDQEKFAQSDLKVLLVEDDREFADILRIRLSKETNPRLAITCLPTLQQAQQALTETTWDLILLDLNLPRKSGREVLAEIKADPQLLHIPVVVLTFSQAETDILQTYDLHAHSYLTKPLLLDQVMKTIQSIEQFGLVIVKQPAT